MKALELVGRSNTPENNSIFFAALCVTIRFAVAAILLGAFIAPRLKKLTRLELKQGMGLGVFGGIGLILQMDAMAYTQASTCAFLTQAYCIWLPVWFAFRHRRWPPVIVIVASAMVLLGGAILAGVDFQSLRLGRGEWETLAGSVLFTGQILWLERPEFRNNDVSRFSLIMFVSIAFTSLPTAWFTATDSADLIRAYSSPAALGLLALLILLCTLVSFLLANRWQPEIPATEAGLLYSTEPVFTAAVSLVLPSLISQWCAISYPNEKLSANLLIGGGLVLAANIALQLQSAKNHPLSPTQ